MNVPDGFERMFDLAPKTVADAVNALRKVGVGRVAHPRGHATYVNDRTFRSSNTMQRRAVNPWAWQDAFGFSQDDRSHADPTVLRTIVRELRNSHANI